MPNPWFRFYSETLRDRKLERIARVTGQPKALIVGVWVTILSLANDSPIPGALLLTEDIPLALGDIAMEADMPDDVVSTIIERFQAMQMMIVEDDVHIVANWDKRQFKSDSSIERVRRYRERKAATQDSDGNDDVTLHVTDPSVSVSVSVSESVSEGVDSKTSLEAYGEILSVWAKFFPSRPHPTERNKALRSKTRARWKDPDFRDNWAGALERMTHATPWTLEQSWFTLNWFLVNDENWRKCADGNYDDKKQSAPKKPPTKKRIIVVNGEQREAIA